ncbi:metallophosphoesterase [Candidatus Aciduliprofundum boonei]|uniref:Phosphoesterase n=1 Tax=Aciduliprofundum boonei (strain DSM 19572 / T469) TaxID=439481 RepID=B5IH44_ACIB4|nr:metallophosphoesterase family protein [Candidatus Aciduliprofundum boonei]ADD08882.1 phosphodiesterase, MJ0936 family [Aciduliprofundum boonei T469]EDY34415.1 phosphodiesterase, MJ0936 family [Aciduliprofundum boonei T469]HII54802.1 metallophosphoesterase family protein [Candidatus Aciduliprofundum boonei]
MLAIISDIHGNLPALKVVLERIEDADIILCAGDLVGYNPWPNEVIWEIRKRKIPCIRGNHDRAVIYDSYFRFNPYAATAASWTRNKLTKENMEYLYSLKDHLILDIEGKRIALHHGAPFDEDRYIYPDEATGELLEYDNADLLILGHTHVPFVNVFERGVIINPGSVGQPRDGDPRASYALVDLKNKKYEIKRVEYPIDEVYNKIIEEGLPTFLGERLYIGY